MRPALGPYDCEFSPVSPEPAMRVARLDNPQLPDRGRGISFRPALNARRRPEAYQFAGRAFRAAPKVGDLAREISGSHANRLPVWAGRQFGLVHLRHRSLRGFSRRGRETGLTESSVNAGLPGAQRRRPRGFRPGYGGDIAGLNGVAWLAEQASVVLG